MTSNTTTPTDPYEEIAAAVAANIITRLPDTARLIGDMHPLSCDPENTGEPAECAVCGTITCASYLSVLVDSKNMPDAGGPIYVEACDHCIDRVSWCLRTAGIGVDEDYDDDEN
ncbi:hypothetical protein ACTXOY_12965 [Corynebacterium variabile]|uniref:hypothetical protein n=1 Tax=Corynebacterium variabile TaxID=1727 RepID=UPI003FD01388